MPCHMFGRDGVSGGLVSDEHFLLRKLQMLIHKLDRGRSYQLYDVLVGGSLVLDDH